MSGGRLERENHGKITSLADSDRADWVPCVVFYASVMGKTLEGEKKTNAAPCREVLQHLKD